MVCYLFSSIQICSSIDKGVFGRDEPEITGFGIMVKY